MAHTNEERYEYLTGVIMVSHCAMNMLLSINGETKETYNDALYYFDGARDIDAAIDEYNADMED